MARMYPEHFPPGTPGSEQIVFDALAQLSDEWMVFHSVAWQGERHGRQGDGEADFVIAHQSKGVLVVEVKGGAIEIVDGQWVSISRNGSRHSIRNPFEQAVDSKHALGRYLSTQIPRFHRDPRMGHVVAFPDIEVNEAFTPEGPLSIVWDRYAVRDIERAVNRSSSHWQGKTKLDEEQFAALRRALAPTKQIRRLLRHKVEDVVEELVDLTEQQAMTLRLLRRHRRALITGGAGTGKTVLAIERAEQLAESGSRVLLLCFNAPLGDAISLQTSEIDGVTAGNFHKVARQIAADADMLPEGDWDDEWWTEKLPSVLPDAAQRLGLEFDAVIVDEGQDFHESWWTALELIMGDPDSAFFYVFADSHQNLYRDGWEPPFEAEPFELDINCRNTLEVAERVNAVFERDEPSIGTSGPEPVFVKMPNQEEAPQRVASLIQRLLANEGLRTDQITVLATSRTLVKSLRGMEFGDVKLTAPGGRGVAVETVHRFKGLEDDAIVLVLDEVEDDADRALAYVGMSRARVVLFVLGPAESKEALYWT